MIPRIDPEETWEDQELGPGDAHCQQQDLDEDEGGMSPARCEDLTGDYTRHECRQDKIKEGTLIELWSEIDRENTQSIESKKAGRTEDSQGPRLREMVLKGVAFPDRQPQETGDESQKSGEQIDRSTSAPAQIDNQN